MSSFSAFTNLSKVISDTPGTSAALSLPGLSLAHFTNSAMVFTGLEAGTATTAMVTVACATGRISRMK